MRQDRVGRKRTIKWVLQCYRKRDKKAYLTVGQIARRMGLKSSTYLKNVLKEMSQEDEEIIHLQQGGMDMWRFQPYEKTNFLDRIPVIKNRGIVQQLQQKSTLGQLLNMMITEVQS